MGEATAKVTVLFFAKSRELTGTREATLEVPRQISSVGLLNKLISVYNSLEVLRESLVLSLNEEYVSIDDVTILELNTNDTIAVIPPISGG
ncbi:Molybdopterin synthase catalytic subunit [Mactra antiquata]